MTDPQDILRRLDPAALARLDRLEIFPELESTNSYLLQQQAPPRGRFRIAIADHQTAGRGRNGKLWLSPPLAGLCLSIAYTFEDPPHNLPSLTLAVGAAVARALAELGVRDMGLKWPNDLIANEAKLGGILTEAHANGAGNRTVVVGLGLNVELPDTMRREPPAWTAAITDLASCMAAVPARPMLAGSIIECLIDTGRRFDRDGFGGFQAEWARYDWLKQKLVSVEQPKGPVVGIADGIDNSGALRVDTDAGIERVVSGTVKLPLAAIEMS